MNCTIRNLSYPGSGTLKIAITGTNKERFLNICSANHIFVWNIQYMTACYHGNIYAKDFFHLQKFCRKCNIKVRILERKGLIFFFKRHPSVRSSGITFLVFILFLLFFTGRIWKISIDGNSKYTDNTFLRFLSTAQISVGTKKNHLNCKETAWMIRTQYDGITWVSVQLHGSTLHITVKEKPPEEDASNENVPCNLRVPYSGTIVKAVVREGVLQIPVGTECKKGDRVVEGSIPLYNDSQEILRYSYIKADADIYLRRSIHYKDILPTEITRRTYTKKRCYSYFLQIGQYRFCLGNKNRQVSHTSKSADYLQIPSSLIYKPCISAGCYQWNYYEEAAFIRSPQAMEKLLSQRLEWEIRNLKEKGVEILQNNVKIEINSAFGRAQGDFIIIEKTPMETERIIFNE